ncbi:uncharacterized protein BO88DRAFT_407101 [Aspergillus vadensis CBS 113365]|uniref:Conserved oligomeric Golgi complex subunit 1 n=1 Tax=Aspergillus vadensis (strain CBS 113365 / IMI 142717 / IBT 24658) TaxID=1448311 RepID=A0A319B0L7_ASPVC|nr:hypothetical protein BO88DRAFT_407101 [Aspergillus vadensis CBS 113365]PYH66167.1 hypothetical protein BO88DRAFT_407101 [Aspergillus vadensis CBS 113365]
MASDGPDPQSLKSWQDAFHYPIPTVRRVEQELRRDIASNKEKLRALVGTRYRELIGTAETIVSMNCEMEDVDSTLADIGRRCNPRLMEKMYTHYNQIKEDSHDEDAAKRALGGQLALLHRCTSSISKLLRRRGSVLLVAKLMVISRLLHKTLSQQATVPPFVEDLRNQLASLQRSLLRRLGKRLASAKYTADEIIEALAAYCLTTSSSSDDAIRYFHRVRLDGIGSQLELVDPSGENVLSSLRLYVRTLQTSKILLSRRLSDVLSKLKARPLLTDPEVRSLDDLDLGVLGRWVAADVNNFTPWIKLSELSKSDAEKTIKQWSKPAFDKFLNGCRGTLTNWLDFSKLLSLRKQTLELWLSSRSSTPTHSSLQVLEGIRSVFNDRLRGILSEQAKTLDLFGQGVASAVSNWSDRAHAASQSLWSEDLISHDYSNGSAAFKQAVTDRLLGRDDDVTAVLVKYQEWLSAIEESRESIDGLRQVRWSDVLDEGEDEDLDIDVSAMLNDDDTRLLREALQVAIGEAFDTLQSSLSTTFKTLEKRGQSGEAAFMLKTIRLARRDLPVQFIASDYALSQSIVPDLQRILATDIVSRTGPWKSPATSKSKSGKVPGRTLWEGDPEIPVQPTPSTFKFLRKLVRSMDQYGAGLWDVSTTQTLKSAMIKGLSESVTSSLEKLNAPAEIEGSKKPASHDDEETEPAQNGENGENGDPAKPNSESTKSDDADDIKDRRIQLYFDTVYLNDAFATRDSERSQLAEVLDTLRSSLDLPEKATKKLDNAAHEYWKRTQLLFGLLTVGPEH